MTSVLDIRLVRALELLGNKLDPEIEQTFPTLEERILAQALENVEEAERKLRAIQELVGDVAVASSNADQPVIRRALDHRAYMPIRSFQITARVLMACSSSVAC